MHSFRKDVTGVKEKSTSIVGHVEYIQSEFQTLHNETIPAIGDKLTVSIKTTLYCGSCQVLFQAFKDTTDT